MFDDEYRLLGMYLDRHGTSKFPREEITEIDKQFIPAIQRLIDQAYLFAHRFYPTVYVTQTGLRAYQAETLRRKDQAFAQAEKEAKEKENDRIHQQRADKLARKDARRSWWQWGLRIGFDLLIFLLGVYLGGATKTFQWFIAIFH